jgi:hypothetical protein
MKPSPIVFGLAVAAATVQAAVMLFAVARPLGHALEGEAAGLGAAHVVVAPARADRPGFVESIVVAPKAGHRT